MSLTPIEPDRGLPPVTPRWVKVAGIIVIVLVLLAVVVLVTGIGGEHGPSRHTLSGETDNNLQSSSLTAETTPSSSDPAIHTPPVEHDMQQP
jgi:hypothetical protein